MPDRTEHDILICLGSSCYSRGNAENLEFVKRYLKTNGVNCKINFRGHLCNELCNKGPVINIDDKEYLEVTQSNLPTILSHHFE